MSGLLEDGYLVGTKHVCRLCKKERAALEVMVVVVVMMVKAFVSLMTIFSMLVVVIVGNSHAPRQF